MLCLYAGQSGYAQSFVEHYLPALAYFAELTRDIQVMLAAAVGGINLGIYSWPAFRQHSRSEKPGF